MGYKEIMYYCTSCRQTSSILYKLIDDDNELIKEFTKCTACNYEHNLNSSNQQQSINSKNIRVYEIRLSNELWGGYCGYINGWKRTKDYSSPRELINEYPEFKDAEIVNKIKLRGL